MSRIFGIDFTSAPNPRKPITCAVCDFAEGELHLLHIQRLTSFAAFESLLGQPGPWIAGFDFPFSQPRSLIERLAWPTEWAALVEWIAVLGKGGFEQAIYQDMSERSAGDKLQRRATDRIAGSISPMNLNYVPVGKMFWQGAPRLLRAGLSLPAHGITGDERVALEVYPGLLVRNLIGRSSYKNDSSTDLKATRAHVLDRLLSPAFTERYKLRPTWEADFAEAAVHDLSGDTLDALLCAVQAAWASTQPNWAIPPAVDPLEGWIIDPATVI